MIDALGNPQSILLVGGTSEIGRATLDRIAESGRLRRIILAGRDPEGLEKVASDFRARGIDVTTQSVDLADPASVQSFTDWIGAGELGDLDAALLLSGVLPDAERGARDPAYAAEVIQVNATGPIAIGTALAQVFREQGRGALVAMSTVAAERPRADNYLYGASKVALDAWANGLADALAGSAVRVVVIRPGMVRTRMSAGLPEAPMTVDPEVVADAIAASLRGGPVTVWVPGPVRYLMSGLRHLPRPVFRKVAERRG